MARVGRPARLEPGLPFPGTERPPLGVSRGRDGVRRWSPRIYFVGHARIVLALSHVSRAGASREPCAYRSGDRRGKRAARPISGASTRASARVSQAASCGDLQDGVICLGKRPSAEPAPKKSPDEQREPCGPACVRIFARSRRQIRRTAGPCLTGSDTCRPVDRTRYLAPSITPPTGSTNGTPMSKPAGCLQEPLDAL